MVLDLEDIKSITTGAEYVEYTGDSYKFFRFTKEEQSASYDYLMDYPAGVRMEFFTDAEKLKLKVKISDTARVRTYFSFDVFEDGKLIGTIQNLPEEQRVGNYAHKEYKIGSFCGEFDLSGKRSQVGPTLCCSTETPNVQKPFRTNCLHVSPTANRRGILVLPSVSLSTPPIK